MTIREFMKDHVLILDGGMGTLLQGAGLPVGEYPETWNLTHSDVIEGIHRAYYEAGSHVVSTNTFGAYCTKFDEVQLKAVVDGAVQAARRAVESFGDGKPRFVALDLGPTGRLLKPYGDFDFEEAVEVFAKTVRLGVAAGVDLVLIETMNDSYETKAALLAVKENCDLPVLVSNAYGADGKLMTGASPAAMVALAEGMGAEAIGANCSLGPVQLRGVVTELLQRASVPVLLQPNAGLPRVENGITVYDVTPDEFVNEMLAAVKSGSWADAVVPPPRISVRWPRPSRAYPPCPFAKRSIPWCPPIPTPWIWEERLCSSVSGSTLRGKRDSSRLLWSVIWIISCRRLFIKRRRGLTFWM